jgi:hypothetical protein
MKRCPQCNRVETDDALGFCRGDGTALISDSGPISDDAGTAKSGSRAALTEIETSLLPKFSDDRMNRAGAPTRLLSVQTTDGITSGLSKRKRRVFVIAAAFAIATIAVIAAGYLYFTRNRTTAIESIAVLSLM